MEVVYPFHFRYQPAKYGENTTQVAFPGPPEVFLDCSNTPLSLFSLKASPTVSLVNIVTEKSSPKTVFGMIPNGIKEQLPEIQMYTFGCTFIGFLLLSYTIIQKSSERVKLD